MSFSVKSLLEVAYKEVGYAEQPVNKTKYARHFGTDGIQWCGAFVNWCVEKAGGKMHNTFYTPLGAQGFQKDKAWKTKGTIQPGDIVYFDIPNDNVDRISHVGIAVADLGDGRVVCIEGNTTGPSIVQGKKSDERNGGAVALKVRPKTWIVGWGRLKFKSNDDFRPLVKEIVKEATKKPVKKSVMKQIREFFGFVKVKPVKSGGSKPSVAK